MAPAIHPSSTPNALPIPNNAIPIVAMVVHELPVIGISVNKPTMLADAPMLRTYINTYDSNDDTMDALVDALLTGPEAFKGSDPIDAYCGMFDTHM